MSARTITPAPLSASTSTPNPAAAARTKLLLEGQILPTLLRLAAPNVLNLLAFVGVIVFDGFFLGRIGTNALAGASLAFPFVMLVLQTTNSGMGAGVTSAIARALGAGKRDRADELVFHALLLALVLGVVFSSLMLLTAPFIFGWMGGRDEMLSDALAYANVALGGAVCITVLNLLGNAGARHWKHEPARRRTGWLRRRSYRAHAPADLRLGPIPGTWSRRRGVGTGDPLCLRQPHHDPLSALLGFNRAAELPRNKPLDGNCFADILKVGVPGLINTAITNLSIVILTGIAGQFGPEAAIGYAMGARLEYIMQPVAFGFGTAIVAMVGTNWGAGQYHRARQIAWTGALTIGSRVRDDWTGRRNTTEPLAGPIQQRPRSRALWRAVSSDCWAGVPVLRARPRLVFRQSGLRPRYRGDERQRRASDCERGRGYCSRVLA